MNRTVTILLLSVGALLVLGLATLASLTMSVTSSSSDFVHPWLLRQALACVMGFVGLAVASSLDYRRLDRWVWPAYIVTLVLLALVLTPLGTANKGAQRWLWGVQPSEFAKLTLVLALAWFGARFAHRIQAFSAGVLGMGAVAVPMLILIVVEPDKGTTALLAAVTGGVMVVAGVRWSHLLVPVVGFCGLFGALLARPGYARERVLAFLNPEQNATLSYQVERGLDAFGNGGLFGVGFADGLHKFKVPEVHTDFILPAVGEEFGLVFTLGVTVAFVVILIAGALVAHRAKDGFGMLLATGITFLIASQALVNLGVVTHLLPNKGMALPFLSRGGTGTVVLLTMVGLLISVARQALPAVTTARSAPTNPFGEPDTDFPR